MFDLRGARLTMLAGVLLGFAPEAAFATPRTNSPVEPPSPSKAAGAVIEFSDTSFDFGEIYEGQRVVHTFRVRNAGTEDLRLDPIVVDSFRTACNVPDSLSIVTPSAPDPTDTMVVKPGATEDIVVTFNSEGFAVEGFDGRIDQRIRVYSNDPEHPRSLLRVTGHVKAVVLRPPVVMLGAAYKGDVPPELPPVRLVPTGGQAFKFVGVESNSPFLHPVLVPVSDRTGGYHVIKTAVDPGLPVGVLEDVALIVRTTHPQKPMVVIPVSGEVSSSRPVVVTPPFADLGLLRPGQSTTIRLLVERGPRPDWQIVGAKPSLAGVRLDVGLKHVGPRYEVALTLVAPRTPWTAFDGEVELTTDIVGGEKIAIPVIGWTYGRDPFSIPADRLREYLAGVLGHKFLQKPEQVWAKALATGRDPRALQALVALAADKNVDVRVRATALLAESRRPEAIGALDRIARHDEEELVRHEALTAYVKVAPQTALPLLLVALHDGSALVREEAATQLGVLGDSQATPALLVAIHDKAPEVALAAVEALEKFLGAKDDSAVRTPSK